MALVDLQLGVVGEQVAVGVTAARVGTRGALLGVAEAVAIGVELGRIAGHGMAFHAAIAQHHGHHPASLLVGVEQAVAVGITRPRRGAQAVGGGAGIDVAEVLTHAVGGGEADLAQRGIALAGRQPMPARGHLQREAAAFIRQGLSRRGVDPHQRVGDGVARIAYHATADGRRQGGRFTTTAGTAAQTAKQGEKQNREKSFDCIFSQHDATSYPLPYGRPCNPRHSQSTARTTPCHPQLMYGPAPYRLPINFILAFPMTD